MTARTTTPGFTSPPHRDRLNSAAAGAASASDLAKLHPALPPPRRPLIASATISMRTGEVEIILRITFSRRQTSPSLTASQAQQGRSLVIARIYCEFFNAGFCVKKGGLWNDLMGTSEIELIDDAGADRTVEGEADIHAMHSTLIVIPNWWPSSCPVEGPIDLANVALCGAQEVPNGQFAFGLFLLTLH